MTSDVLPVSLPGNPYLHMGRAEAVAECQFIGARGKHTASFDSRARWRVESIYNPGRYRLACNDHLGMAAQALIRAWPYEHLAFYRLPDFLKVCPEHGEYLGAWILGLKETPCPACQGGG